MRWLRRAVPWGALLTVVWLVVPSLTRTAIASASSAVVAVPAAATRRTGSGV